jgi:hypothetical protein
MRVVLTTLATTLALLVATGASGGSAASSRLPILGIVPHSGGSLAAAALPATSPNPTGPLSLAESPCTLSSSPYPCWTMRTNTTYAIYWLPRGYSVDANYESLINRYLSDVAAASGSQGNVYSVSTQYYDDAAAVHYQSTFASSYVDTDPFPASGCSDGVDAVCLTDEQIQAEIQNVLTRKGWHGSTTKMFFVMTPNGVGSCFDNVTNECTTNAYCAYHSGFFDTNNEPVVYANEAYAATINGCFVTKNGQGSPNGDDADATISTISHEHSEAITDPAGDAWLSSSGAEIGDICAWTFGTKLGTVNGQPYNQVINGHDYDLQQEYSNDGDTCLLQYTPTVAPATVAPPVVSGAAGQGQLLSTSEGSWMHAPSGYAYQWQRCAADGAGCADISGATASTYRLTADDVGHTFRSGVSAHNAAGTSAGFVTSTHTPVVLPLPSATASPVVTGVAAVGKTLFATTGAWNTTVSVAYAWLRCAADGSGCNLIPGAADAAYLLAAADAGHTLEARVSATNAAGTTSADSNRTAVVLTVPAALEAPHISGRARVGRRLSTTRGTWIGSPTTYRFQWLRCNTHGGSCAGIARARHSRYRLTKHDAGHRLRVRVTAVGVVASGTATSAASARVPSPRKR